MPRTHRRRLPHVLVLALSVWIGSACVMGLPEKGQVVAGAGQSLVLGVISPRGGVLAGEGEGIVNAVRLAVQRNGPLDGHAIELRAVDDGCQASQSEAAARALMAEPRLIGVVGPTCSAGCVAAGNLLYERAIVMVTPRCTDIAVTRQGAEGVFRTVWTDAFEASAAARFARFNLNAKRVFIVHDGTVYGKNLRDLFRGLWGEDNLEGVSELRAGDDPGSVIRSIARSEAQVIQYFGFAAGAAEFLVALRSAGVTAPVLAPEAAFAPELVEKAGAAAEGLRITRVAPPSAAPLSQFGDLYQEAFGAAPPPFAAEAYDAARAILAVASDRGEREGSRLTIDRRRLREAMYRTDVYGVTGRLRFRPNGDRLQGARVEILRVQDGAFGYERTVILPE